MSHLILVVDDEPSTRYMLRLLLEMDGFAVLEAGDGCEALKQVDNSRPDLMLLDVMMPVMDGLDTCRELRRRRETADLPVIMMSGKTYEQDVREGIAAGANKYISKPFPTDVLIANINEMLTGHTMAMAH